MFITLQVLTIIDVSYPSLPDAAASLVAVVLLRRITRTAVDHTT